VWLRRPAGPLPFPLGEPGCRLFSRARHALYRALTELVEPGGEILAPAFHHGSEIEVFGKVGLTPVFYEGGPKLEPDEAELETLVGPRTRALHLTHYLGHPQDGPRWRRWCDDRGLLLIEDAAQAWLSARDGRPAGAEGDISVWCLYKMFGLADGAALLTRQPTNGVVPAGNGGLFWAGMEHVLWLATRARPVAWLADRRAPRIGTIEYMFELGETRAPTGATLAALPRVATPDAAAIRRANYRRYLELLPDRVARPFAELPEGASPFTFPAVFQDKPRALERLRWSRVRALNLWSMPHPALPVERFPRAMELRRTVVGLPVHQELRSGDIERVAEAASLLP
jgi:dTDP-4-amino-4,6-dideoxygalactose transaminase